MAPVNPYGTQASANPQLSKTLISQVHFRNEPVMTQQDSFARVNK